MDVVILSYSPTQTLITDDMATTNPERSVKKNLFLIHIKLLPRLYDSSYTASKEIAVCGKPVEASKRFRFLTRWWGQLLVLNTHFWIFLSSWFLSLVYKVLTMKSAFFCCHEQLRGFIMFWSQTLGLLRCMSFLSAHTAKQRKS